jgi:hypothetical protein
MAFEARFAQSWLADDLRGRTEAASIPSGRGALLLTRELAHEGFAVTAIERRAPRMLFAVKIVKATRLLSLTSIILAPCQPSWMYD